MADEAKVRVQDERRELAGLTAEELRARKEEIQKQLWKARFDLGKRQLTDTASLSKMRKQIGRINTYLHHAEANGQTIGQTTVPASDLATVPVAGE